jgi:ectoine hydroxylase-related dioxygenase (phytanoyl-CoA dioxygenase family)
MRTVIPDSVDLRAYQNCWQEKGYVVIRSAVSEEEVQQTVKAIFDFLEMSPSHPESWYDANIRGRSGIDEMGRIPFYHHQALWDNRQNPRIHAVFQELMKCDDLLVSIDRVNMNPPVTTQWQYEGFIHWDFDVSARPLQFKPQGLLCLTDDAGNAGGFQCVPGFHRIIDEWLAAQPPGYNNRFPDTTGMEIESVALNAGDFVIFHGALPHGNRPNYSDAPRLAQYFTFFPRAELGPIELNRRLEAYRNGRPTTSITGKPFPVCVNKSRDTSGIELSILGRKILGDAT